MMLSRTPASPTLVIANGNDTYDFTLKIRDRYGNATNGGSVSIEYTDNILDIQENSGLGPYISYGSGYAIIGGGVMDITTNLY